MSRRPCSPSRRAELVASLLLLPWVPSCGGPASPDPADAELDAGIVLDLSVAFHDPEGLWPSGVFDFAFEESRPEGGQTTVRRNRILLRNAESYFELETERDGRQVEVRVEGERATVLAGGEPLEPAAAKSLGLGPDRARRLRDYYLFLFGIPMKLRDPGTRLDPDASRGTFGGRDVLELRVTYDPEVGSDVWTFLVDPLDYALVGCRFDHAPGADDGETIELEGLAAVDGLRLPRVRHWKTNRDGRYLGTDTILVDEAANLSTTRRGGDATSFSLMRSQRIRRALAFDGAELAVPGSADFSATGFVELRGGS